ncbi:MAG: hypothetical protein U9N06_02620 [candidate division WOR-3 bacterium]|nr:hypothetical protein [candidate division WOR-3 bacterium]
MKKRNPELEVMIKLERIPEVHKKTSQSGTTFGYNLHLVIPFSFIYK